MAADVNIELTADGTGNVVFNTSKVNVNGNLHATGDITFDGDITFGSDNTDQVVFSSDIASNLIPDQNNLYSLGSLSKKWNTLYTTELITSDLTANTAVANNIDLLATQGTTLYVSVNGSDTNTGTHLHSPFRTIKHALSQAVSGECIYVFPGDYEEELPLLVPQGVSINGASIRATRLIPTPETKHNDVFLLNGETTVSNLTIKNFFYDPVNDTGYGFRFAPNCKVTSRSPYVQNVTIINRGTYVPTGDVVDGDVANTASYDTIIDGTDAFATIFSEVIDGEWAFVIDPTLGFNSGDAGRGVLVDGSVVHPDSVEAAMLFHAVTLIVPNAEGITAKNGARVEWLNSFTYFANRGIHLTEGTEGFAGLGVRFGAEMRSINSANVYGNYGAVADGANTLGYLIGHNFGYVGSGYFSTNDPKLVNQANEIVPINGGRLYFDSMDQRGDFRIGDIFIVNQETGSVSFVAQTINFGASGSIVLEGVNGVTIIDLSGVQTGNIKVSGNTIQSLSGPVNIFAIDNHTNLGNNTFITGNLDVTGDVHVGGNVYLGNNPLDLVNVVPRLTQNINPKTTNTFTLGETNKRWRTGFLNELNIDNIINILSNSITTLTANTDLKFLAPANKTYYETTDWNYVNWSGNELYGFGMTNIELAAIPVGATFYVNNDPGTLYTVTSNTTQNPAGYIHIGVTAGGPAWQTITSITVVPAGGAGKIHITSTDVQIDNNITIVGTTTVNGLSTLQDVTTTGTINLTGNIGQTGDTYIIGTFQNNNIKISGAGSYFSVPDIKIQNNTISATATDSDLNFIGTGGVVLDNKLKITDSIISNVWTGATTNSQKSIRFTPSGTGNLVVNSTSFLTVPYGNNSNKILSVSGEIRQNSTTGSYEGYLSTGPESFTNLYDVDRNTYITPELTIGANDNILRFGVNGTVRATIDSTKLETPAMQVGNLIFSGSTINNPFSGSNINLDPNGTGSLNLNDILVKDNTITNTKDSAIVLKNTGTGYVKFAGTYGVAFPYGNNSERRLTPETGESRYNTQLNYMEVFNGTTWIPAVGTLGAAPLAEVLDIMDFWGLILG